MDDNYKTLLRLVGEIYESSINPSHWPVVMERLTKMTQSKSAVLVIHDREIKQISHLHAFGVPKLAMALLNNGMAALDPGLRVMREQPPGKAKNMYRLDDAEKIPRVFHAMLVRLSNLFFFGGVNCFNDETWLVGIGLHRTREQGEFEPAVLEMLEELVPHFQRALRIQKEFTRLQLSQQMLHAELDRHIIGLILLGDDGAPFYFNPMAQRIIKQHAAIEVRNKRLRAHNPEEDQRLQQAISEAAHTLPNTLNQTQALGLTHRDHAMPLAVLVVPTATAAPHDSIDQSHSHVAIYLTDPENPIPIANDALMSVYGLSEREAKVAVAIANGRDLGEIAAMHHVSPQTVRSQLKSIFRKTGVNRQSDLVRLLIGGPLMM